VPGSAWSSAAVAGEQLGASYLGERTAEHIVAGSSFTIA
jgi:hypothetical protein